MEQDPTKPNRGTVFVTGATGYVGRFLVRRLVEASRRVRCLTLPDDTIEPRAVLPVEVVRGDVTRLETLLAHGDGVGGGPAQDKLVREVLHAVV